MKKEIEELKSLGANVIEVNNGLKLIGDWKDDYNKYHNLFVEITGSLYTPNVEQHPEFLNNLNSLRSLYTPNVEQHPEFLNNLTSLGGLYTYNTKQHPEFLNNLTSLGSLYTYNTKQHPEFLSNLTSLGSLYTPNVEQHPEFLRNLASLGGLYTYDIAQHKDFLRNLASLGGLYTSDATQHPEFLSNLASLGGLSYNTVQHPEFLKNSKSTFDLPYIYADRVLSIVKSTKEIDGITIHNTNRVGYKDTEYIAEQDGVFAHAKTVELALIDLRFKQSDRDTSWLKDKKLSDELSFSDAVLAYRCVTGACSGGVEHFLNKHNKKEKYTISEIIKTTKGEYGNNAFKKFFQEI